MTNIDDSNIAAIPGDDEKNVIQNAILTHALPFVAWLAIMTMLPGSAWGYAFRTIACTALLFWFCPWRWYPSFNLKNIPLSVIVGVVVFVIWVAPESQTLSGIPGLRKWYDMLFIMPPWKLPEVVESSPYAPENCGWALTIIRLLGSAIVVALLEEFFWRGFLYRWMLKSNFLSVDPGRMHVGMFFTIAVLFGLEHDRWLVGIAAGLAYGWLYYRTRDIWAACLAHGITNFILGIYALATKAYQFW